MTALPQPSALLLAVLAGMGCRGAEPPRSQEAGDSVRLAQREARVAEALAEPDSTRKPGTPAARWVMPRSLAEISGLALTPDGRLLAHNDERGVVSEIDYRKGTIVKQFILGHNGVRADFEGMTVMDDAIFLLASNGSIYEFREGGNGEKVDYTVHDTHLGRECEFEGVAYDSTSHSLLMACKHVYKKHLKGNLVLYRWKVRGGDGPRLSTLTVPLARVIGTQQWKTFNPSDITVEPTTGHLVIIASLQHGMTEITLDGRVVRSSPLPGNHPMAEGVAITRDHLLLISDEATTQPAVLTLYRWP